jgi:hypothetical protein
MTGRRSTSWRGSAGRRGEGWRRPRRSRCRFRRKMLVLPA